MGKPKNISAQIVTAIKQAERGGMSRYAIAKAAGMRLTVLIRIADGGTIPRLDTAEKIARAIGKRLTIVPK